MKISIVKYLMLLSLMLVGANLSAQTTFADNFTTQIYNANDGTGTWSTNWIEIGDDGFPNFGDTFIFTGTTTIGQGNLAFLGDNEVGDAITRAVDLSGASLATLEFDWQTNELDFSGGAPAEELEIAISSNGGAFQVLNSGTIIGTNTGSVNIPITGFISANTVIRFRVTDTFGTGFEGGEFAVIDNLVISAIFGPTLSILDVSFNETAGNVSVTVTHVGPSTSGPFTVDVDITDGTAISGNDFNVTSPTLSFSGVTGDTDTVDISIIDDGLVEIDEIFNIGFTNVSDPLVDISAQNTVTITNDDLENPRPYEERFKINLRGNFEMIGNTNLICTANCAAPTTNNPPVFMDYASIDATTVNSSSATLNLPIGVAVVWAGLYWGGSNASNLAGINQPDPTLIPTQIRLREPGTGIYTTVNAAVTNFETSNIGASWNVFMSFADITSTVQNAGAGVYTVADIALTTGSAFTGPFGGWTMVIVYEDPSDITRSVSIWDGFDFFGFGANDAFTVTGLLTPSLGSFDTKAGYFGMDGEANQVGDFVDINGTALTNVLNPADNTLNSTISSLGVDVGGRNPNQVFNWGLDIDTFDATGLVPNSATDIDVGLGSANEGIWGGVFALSTEVAFPTVASKNFTPATVGYNEISTVSITLENPSTGVNLTNLSLSDDLPFGMIIAPTPNTSSSCGGTISAIPGDDSFSVSGLNLDVGDSCTFTFDVLGNELGSHDNIITSDNITNDQGVPLSATAVGTLNVIVRSVITNRRITYRVKL